MIRISLGIVLLLTMLNADKSVNAKAVFDCTSGDMRYVAGRIKLIGATAGDIAKLGQTPKFVLTVHSGCVPLMVSHPEDYMEEGGAELVSKAQLMLQDAMGKYDIEVRVCEIAMEAWGIGREELLTWAKTTPNSFVDTIALQNEGYALMLFGK